MRVVGDVVHRGFLCSSVLSVLRVPCLRLVILLYYSRHYKKFRVRNWARKVRNWARKVRNWERKVRNWASSFFKDLPIGTLLWKTFLTTYNDTCMYAKGEKLGVVTWASALRSICGEQVVYLQPAGNSISSKNHVKCPHTMMK